jgi:hypothetical protein
MQLIIRPLAVWPYEPQPTRPATYKVTYSRTKMDLEQELIHVYASDVLIGLVVDERDVRQDGQLRADARVKYDGVELSFNKPGTGRVVFHTDRHRGYRESWQDNLRAIALGMEALRAVDRYGITTSGQQYAGFAALSAGPGKEERGKQLVEKYGSIPAALRATHPDTGTTAGTDDFQSVMAYRKLVEA